MVESLFHSTLRTVIVRYPDFKKYKKYIKGIWDSEVPYFRLEGLHHTLPNHTIQHANSVVRNHIS